MTTKNILTVLMIVLAGIYFTSCDPLEQNRPDDSQKQETTDPDTGNPDENDKEEDKEEPDNDEFAELGHFVDTELRFRFGNFVRVGFDRVFRQREQRIHHEPAEQLPGQHGQQLRL